MTRSRFYGVDFSGDANKWKSGCRTSNVWVAEAAREGGSVRLVGLCPVQELQGTGNPFARLTALLNEGDYEVAAIDAPFSIPVAHIPDGGHAELLENVALFPTEGRPFAKGEKLVACAEKARLKDRAQPLRRTESEWKSRGVNTRSTLWNGPRGGAPFAVACLTLIQRSGRPCWPWKRETGGLLAEAFPAGQLRQWDLQHDKYGKDEPKHQNQRKRILECAARVVKCPPQLCGKMLDSADALDAFLCLFAAIAVADKRAHYCRSFGEEGWIATHPKFDK